MGLSNGNKLSLSFKVYSLAALGMFSVLFVAGTNFFLTKKTDKTFAIEKDLKSLISKLDQEKILRVEFLLNHDETYLKAILDEQTKANEILATIKKTETNDNIAKKLLALETELAKKNKIFEGISVKTVEMKKNENITVSSVYNMTGALSEIIAKIEAEKEAARKAGDTLSPDKEELLSLLKDGMINTKDVLFTFNGLLLGKRSKGFTERQTNVSDKLALNKTKTAILLSKLNIPTYSEKYDAYTKSFDTLNGEFSKIFSIWQANEDFKSKFEDQEFEVDGAILEVQKDLTDYVYSNASFFKNISIIFSALMVLVLAIVSYFIVKPMNRELNAIVTSLRSFANLVFTSSEEFMKTSQDLSESSNRQASSVQETVSSLDEISAMVRSNVDVSEKSKDLTKELMQTADQGKQVVTTMMKSIEDVSASNEDIMKQMDKTNDEMENISKVIAQIGEKTKIINDIVFQTKLLSFNASVEAARAGEHGKGFAVVAEEVGNLAQVSGNAATEISNMLAESIKNVQTMVEGNRTRIESLIDNGKQKVKHSLESANECSDALENIITKVVSVDEMTAQVAVASKEQSEGITEINKAMGYIDQSTQENTTMANSTSVNAQSLNDQAKTLNKSVDSLLTIVNGGKASHFNAEDFEKNFEHNDKYEEPKFESVTFDDDELPSDDDFVEVKAQEIKTVQPKVSEKVVEMKKTPAPQKTDNFEESITASSVIPDRNDDRFEDVG
ncbi:methyl-accepting chemotaxis protein signaling domain protein [Bacteriovorax sp. BSW11_IV]|uniref:methyl-accepting chemotaxis protein n=1 Tax=Bacteriovorax sp. BSW11_IV TaxID=1353529 RepID=UPI00038A2D36|nr:methyl-accepting chemotaxis protein [Bacteriovorax sp. BSW11_IV]EQC45798.1 methyl-accepting chemotaxis protein signaling domain protein [Bacteriovorax sp. BSW11_IV]